MVLLAKNYHYIKNSNHFFLIFFSIFLAGPGSGRPAPGPESGAGPGNIEKHEFFFLPGPGSGSEYGISVLRILLSPSRDLGLKGTDGTRASWTPWDPWMDRWDHGTDGSGSCPTSRRYWYIWNHDFQIYGYLDLDILY